MSSVKKPSYFNVSTPILAEELLGKFLVRSLENKTIALMITEVEAYEGFADKASHASRGRTLRNEPMFGEAGRWYVYFTYGMHWMLNIVAGPKDYPAAVLIRGVRSPTSLKLERSRTSDVINGPAKLTKFLKIDGKLNGKLAAIESGLWIEDRGVKIKPIEIKKSPRVGVSYAGPYWARRNWRFYLKDSV
ncbi:DNA-3-methyladenine glycosylase [Candidatus Giovannonibacteria bacterium]|nr:DNA-3-methyladenine glycosylase [Candidatus Giovannonibacteria bacterium]